MTLRTVRTILIRALAVFGAVYVVLLALETARMLGLW